MALSIDLTDVTEPMHSSVRELNMARVDTMSTDGDGACAIHSVWGNFVNGTLYKPEARDFLRAGFGPTAEHFRTRIASVEDMQTMELALWDMILPIAKQDAPFGAPPHAGDKEGKLVWNCMLKLSSNVAWKCFEAGQADKKRFQLYWKCKENVIQKFGSLCVEAFDTIFIHPLLSSLGLLEKYTGEDSFEVSEGRRLTKYEALFLGTAGARKWHRNVVNEACMDTFLFPEALNPFCHSWVLVRKARPDVVVIEGLGMPSVHKSSLYNAQYFSLFFGLGH